MNYRLRTKILATLSAVIMSLGIATLTAGPASAHTPNITASCSDLSVSLTNYDKHETNSVVVKIDDVVVDSDADFGSTFVESYTFADSTVAHTWEVSYVAGDDPYGHYGYTDSQRGTSTPCIAKDATASVTLTPNTCDTAQTVVLGATENATWGAITYSGKDNLHYSVTATAVNGHRFVDGDHGSHGATKTFSGTLDAATGNCPPPPCLSDSAVSYTYDAATNSGVITVAGAAGQQLCDGFWVSAASWTYVGNSTWPQTLDQWVEANSGNEIDSVGTYPYGAPVGCGQGDIYATYDAPGVTKPSTSPGTLTGPNTGYAEHFLSQMGFNGPSPTYMNRDAAACYLIPVDTVPAATFTDECGIANDGIIGGIDTDGIAYTITDNRVQGVGEVTVSAAPKFGHAFTPGAYTGPWSHSFTNADCPVTFGDPLVVDQLCGGVDVGLIDGHIWVDLSGNLANEISYQIVGGSYNFTATQATNILPPGDYTVTATAKPGFALASNVQSTWQMMIHPDVLCSLVTHPLISTTATSTNLTCASAGSYTLANTTGVVWSTEINGVVTTVQPGTYQVDAATTVKVHASLLNSDYGWEDDAQTDWTFNFANPTDCLPTLAFTGATGNSGGLLLAGGFLLIGGTAIAFERRFHGNTK